MLASFTYCFAQKNIEIIPKLYTAYQISENIKIDGKAIENDWNRAKWSNLFMDIEGIKKPKYNTRFKMLWDTSYFYLLVDIEEPHIWANLKKRDTIIFHNNDFELFIDPNGDTHNYYEIELNALNTIWDLFITKPYREGNTILNDWTVTGLQSAIKINGTINNPNDIDKGWAIEMAIPWAVFKTSYFEKNIPVDEFWRINFSRVNWDFDIINGKYYRKKDNLGKYKDEYNWVWSPMGVINMHEPEKWGYVYFSSKKPNEATNFKIPQDEQIKWKMFEIHRKLKAYLKKNKTVVTLLDQINEGPFTVNGKLIKPIFETHSQGYSLIVKSPFSKNELILRQDGKFKIKLSN